MLYWTKFLFFAITAVGGQLYSRVGHAKLEYKYDLNWKDKPETDFLVREYTLQEEYPKTFLLCPRGYFIAEISMELFNITGLGENYQTTLAAKSTYSGWEGVPKLFISSEKEDTVNETDMNICPSIERCLFHQACVFHFSIEFCKHDPLPNFRKNIVTTITCVRDHSWIIIPRNATLRRLIEERRDHVASFPPQYSDHAQDELFNSNEVMELSEEFVFKASCSLDPSKAGFLGDCNSVPQDNASISEGIWKVTSRTDKQFCKDAMVEIYCSFLYNKNGTCFPPQFTKEEDTVTHFQQQLDNIQRRIPLLNTKIFPKPLGNHHIHMERYQKLLEYEHRSILPVRIGFGLLVHQNAPAIMQLLKAIYSSEHFYVIHIDARKEKMRSELTSATKAEFSNRKNIRIISKSNSWITSWGSFNIVRAELELLRVLLSMGFWDFSILLSGSDLPIRSLDTLTLALAPYRGFNLFSFHPKMKDLFNWDVQYSCEGFTYSVLGQEFNEDFPLEIRSASQWSVLSWGFANFAINQMHVQNSDHIDIFRSYTYKLMTLSIPDEIFLPTLAVNSEYKSKTLEGSLHWIKRFEGLNKNNLCRHLTDADFCGQGPPPVSLIDLKEIRDAAHSFFFARKFSMESDEDEVVRKLVLKKRSMYSKSIFMFLPNRIIYLLMRRAMDRLKEVNNLSINWGSKGRLKIKDLKVIPFLHSRQPCCREAFINNVRMVKDFSYVIDFDVNSPTESRSVRAKFSLLPPFYCFPSGHLRILRATGGRDMDSHLPRGLATNNPLPFFPAGNNTLFVSMEFVLGEWSTGEDCDGLASHMVGDLANIQNIRIDKDNRTYGDPLRLTATLINPMGKVACIEDVTVEWNNISVQSSHFEADNWVALKQQHFTFNCGPIEEGLWKVRITKKYSRRPFPYVLSMVFLNQEKPVKEPASSKDTEKLVVNTLKLEDVVLLPLPNFYTNDVNDTNETVGETSSETKSSPSIGMFRTFLTIFAAYLEMLNTVTMKIMANTIAMDHVVVMSNVTVDFSGFRRIFLGSESVDSSDANESLLIMILTSWQEYPVYLWSNPNCLKWIAYSSAIGVAVFVVARTISKYFAKVKPTRKKNKRRRK